MEKPKHVTMYICLETLPKCLFTYLFILPTPLSVYLKMYLLSSLHVSYGCYKDIQKKVMSVFCVVCFVSIKSRISLMFPFPAKCHNSFTSRHEHTVNTTSLNPHAIGYYGLVCHCFQEVERVCSCCV